MLMRLQSLGMGNYGEVSEASWICLPSIHLVAIDNTGAGEWEHHLGFKHQGADSPACALLSKYNTGQMGATPHSDFPVVTPMSGWATTAKVAIRQLISIQVASLDRNNVN